MKGTLLFELEGVVGLDVAFEEDELGELFEIVVGGEFCVGELAVAHDDGLEDDEELVELDVAAVVEVEEDLED